MTNKEDSLMEEVIDGFEGILYECIECGFLIEDEPDFDACDNCGGRSSVIPKKNLHNGTIFRRIVNQFYNHK